MNHRNCRSDSSRGLVDHFDCRDLDNAPGGFDWSRYDDVVTALLIAKADVKTKNDEGKTALMLAAEGGHDDTVSVLRRAGAGK